MRKNSNIPSSKSKSLKKEPAPKSRRPMLNSDASPHANQLARPPCFPEIFEEDEDAPVDNRYQSPTPLTRRKEPRSTSSASQPHVLACSTPSYRPAFGSPLRCSAGLAGEEEECAAVYGHRRVDVDKDVGPERASSRGKKKRTLAQAQAEREKRRIREDFEVAAQRLQDVTNAFGARTSLPPLDTNVFGIFSTYL